MPLAPDELTAAADWLFAQLDGGRPVAELLEAFPQASEDDAYRLQLAWLERERAAGARVLGVKAALTAKTMQAFFGVGEPCPGWLTSRGLIETPTVSVGGWVQPNVEPEIAFLMGRRLEGPGVTVADVIGATAGVMPALEVGHLRYGTEQRTLQTFVALNTLQAGFVLGPAMTDLHGLDLRREGMVLELDGRPVGSGCGVAALGDPRAVVAFLANRLARFGHALEPGMVILTGSLIQGPLVAPGTHVRARFTHLGDVSVEYVA